MPEHPLKIFQDRDPKLFAMVNTSDETALAEGAMSRKNKLLIAMVFDAEHGAVNGVQALAREAIKAGATGEEITEALRVAYHLCGVGCIYTAAAALKEIFGQRT